MASWVDSLQQQWDAEDDLAAQGYCPGCGGTEYTLLGQLGSMRWIRCRFCGVDIGVSVPKLEH